LAPAAKLSAPEIATRGQFHPTAGRAQPVCAREFAENNLALHQNLTKLNTDAPIHPAFAGNPGITLGYQLLERDRASYGTDR
jgi:hypothetical protein